MDELSGKVAVVTGGASGIGLAMTRAFLDEGMKVVVADIEADVLAEAVAGLPDGSEVEAVVCDVADAAQVDALRDRAVERFGTAHVICNNAGVSAGGPVWEHTDEDWQWVLGVNLFGVIHGIRAFTPLFIAQGEGHVVNTASMAGLTSMPFSSMYNVSKHGVVTLSETLFADLAMTGNADVGVSVLCPGWVQTRIHEAGRNRPEGAATAEVDEERAAMRAGFADYIGSLIASGLEPAEVAAMVVDAIRTRRFYILTHPEWSPMITGRTDRIVNGEGPRLPEMPRA
jgi:NAD(P)-dependent dehydrogenase (short-subunit alcohol dehydrogenase family)